MFSAYRGVTSCRIIVWGFSLSSLPSILTWATSQATAQIAILHTFPLMLSVIFCTQGEVTAARKEEGRKAVVSSIRFIVERRGFWLKLHSCVIRNLNGKGNKWEVVYNHRPLRRHCCLKHLHLFLQFPQIMSWSLEKWVKPQNQGKFSDMQQLRRLLGLPVHDISNWNRENF